ncbi:SDR family NAD(P)-dependent oxidoreductase [Nonomuraea sp. NN258]|uniref:SDR family NAD(P)-dependent oxidoreductase n=1 Tax=Nonomuraea antri TaxID=2730852 RepID=UPI0015695A1A|nr:SDR family NAD(P)-dependent oxidoreductase [Nonomuraea antri]NRQ33755.1 SDR family NAD(P)-dependent oxidoreductase [Nonomuraea antri]
MNLPYDRALVTGGSTGVGLALAAELRRHGCSRVALCGRDSHRLARARYALGPDVLTVRCDVTDPDDRAHLVSAIEQEWGGLDLLVNNAAVQIETDHLAGPEPATLRSVSDEIETNLAAPVLLTLEALPLLRAADRAAVVNIGSSLAVAPKRAAPVYCATKAALSTYTRALRYQFQESGARIQAVEAVLPLVDTDMTRGRGSGKISPEQAAAEIVQGLARNRAEIYVGKARLLPILMRLAPSVPRRMLRAG